jgi:regulatory protein
MGSAKQQLTYTEAIARAMDICGKAEKCGYDMELKCRDWQLSTEEATKLVSYLLREKFIDPQRYANSFVNDKFRFNKWGKIKLSYALRQKKIEEEFIRRALSQIPENTYQQVLSGLLSSRAKSVKEKDPYTRRGKLMAFAQSRGFEADLSLKIIEGM